MRNNCQLTEKQDSFAFESRGVRLSFCGKSGALKEITCGEARLAPNGLDECVLLVGGETVSSVDPDKLNVNWAKCLFKGAYTVGKNASFAAKTVEDTRDGVQITVETAFADFRLKKHYEITADGEIVRRFTLTYLGKSELRLRGAAVYTPSAAGMEQADWPGAGVPGTHPIPEKAECPVAENGLDLTPGDGLIGGGGETLILHTDSRFVSVYNENLSREASTTAAFMTESGAAVQQRLKVSAILAQGDTVSFGGLRIRLGTGRWLDEAYRIGRFYERLGYRVNPAVPRSELKKLVIYETEIGIVRFRPDKCHNAYNTLQDLSDDLPRLRDIGYNCIQLMPSFPFPGYSVYDLHRPEWQHAYGGDLKAFIARAHRLGLKVIFDVLMHGVIDKEVARYDRKTYSSRHYYYPEWERLSEWEVHPLRAEHPDWFIHMDDGSIFRVYTWSFDWACRGLQDWFIEALQMYVRDLDADGFRFDAPTWVNSADWRADLTYRPDRSYTEGVSETFCRARAAVDPLKKNVIWLTEPESIYLRHSLDVSYTYSSSGFWRPLFEGRMTASQLQDFYILRRIINPKGALYVNWMDNHDSWNHGVQETGEYAYELYDAPFARAMLAVALFQEGAYMAYAKNELFEPDYYRRLLGLRRGERIFSEGDCDYASVRADDPNVICFDWTMGNERLVAAVNMGKETAVTALRGAEGAYTDLVTGHAADGEELVLPSGACALLKK